MSKAATDFFDCMRIYLLQLCDHPRRDVGEPQGFENGIRLPICFWAVKRALPFTLINSTYLHIWCIEIWALKLIKI